MDGAPIGEATPVRFSDPLPSAVDVAIIGGGVIGVFAALELARAGRSVVVLERGRVAGEQSSRNWGWIRQQGRDAAELPLMIESVHLWEEVDRELGGAAGFRRAGTCYLASGEREMARLDGWIELAREHQLESCVLSRDAVAARFSDRGAGAHEWIGGLLTPSDARAEPALAVPAVAALAREAGATIREACAVRALDVEAGRVVGVLTEEGRVRAERTVLAGGAWSALLAGRHGVSLPQLSVRATVARTAPMADLSSGNASDETLAFRRREDGGYTLAIRDRNDHYVGPRSFRELRRFAPQLGSVLKGVALRLGGPANGPDAWRTPRRWDADAPSPFERCRVLDPKPDPKLVRLMRASFAERFPRVGEPAIIAAWAGMIDVTPDELPLCGPVAGLEGLVLATGMSGHGFGIGPAFGRLAARMAMDRPTGHDARPFAPDRFDGASRAV